MTELDGRIGAIHRYLAEQARRPITAEQPAAQRWDGLAASINPALTADPAWPALAATLDRTAIAGFPVTERLSGIAEATPLPDKAALELDRRVVDACPAAMLPPGPARPAPSPQPAAAPATPAAAAALYRPPPPSGPRR